MGSTVSKVAKKPRVSKTKTKLEVIEVVKDEVQETNIQENNNTNLNVEYYFPTPVYFIDRSDFLPIVTEVSEEYLATAKKDIGNLNEIYPVLMTQSYFADPRLKSFSKFIGDTAWNILKEQGYFMQDKILTFSEMWTQEHHKHSLMEQHVHGFGSQMVGFYFLEVPENSSRVIIHDPRPGKVQLNLPEENMSKATPASQMINFQPKPGVFMFANSWLAHSFSRHAAELPIKFVHFNLFVQMAPDNISLKESTTPHLEIV